jgi:hypothetical protein
LAETSLTKPEGSRILHVLRPFELFEKDPAERIYYKTIFALKLCRIEPVGIFFSKVRFPSFNFILCPHKFELNQVLRDLLTTPEKKDFQDQN